MVDDNFLQ